MRRGITREAGVRMRRGLAGIEENGDEVEKDQDQDISRG